MTELLRNLDTASIRQGQAGEFLTRHVNREWGELPEEDRKENEYSLEHGFRLLSAHRTNAGDRL